jgi:hypothetical protein
MRAIKRIGLALFSALCLYGLFFAVQTLRPRQLALTLPVDVQQGDVVLMRSHTWRAELVRLIDGVTYRDGFSHVGLVHARRGDGGWDIVHAVPGKDGTVRLEAWPDIARGGGISEAVIYRANLAPETRERLIALQVDVAAQAVPFDGSFNHNDPSKLYCTELVTTLYNQAGHPVVSDKVLSKRAIFPGHLAGSKHLRRIATTRDTSRK